MPCYEGLKLDRVHLVDTPSWLVWPANQSELETQAMNQKVSEKLRILYIVTPSSSPYAFEGFDLQTHSVAPGADDFDFDAVLARVRADRQAEMEQAEEDYRLYGRESGDY